MENGDVRTGKLIRVLEELVARNVRADEPTVLGVACLSLATRSLA